MCYPYQTCKVNTTDETVDSAKKFHKIYNIRMRLNMWKIIFHCVITKNKILKYFEKIEKVNCKLIIKFYIKHFISFQHFIKVKI